MSDNVFPLTTEHLRLLREDNQAIRAALESGFEDMRKRLNRVEQQNAGLKRDEAATEAELADHQKMLDEILARLRRVEQRLEQG